MRKKHIVRGMAALLVVAAIALSAGAVVMAQGGGVPEQGLPARYIPAFDGAGIDVSAILGPYCKSASTAGNTLSVVCQTDTGAEHTTTLTSGAGSGGLDRAAVDARVRAGVSDWALDGNNDPIPAGKLINVSTNLPNNNVLEATVTLNAHDIRHLDNQRVSVIPAPEPGQDIIVRDITIIKTGSGTLGSGTASMGLALAGASGGLLPMMPAQPGGESSRYRSVYRGAVGDDVDEILQDGNYVRYVEPAAAMGYLAWADQPLVVYGQAPNPADWDTATDDLVGVTLEFLVRYELRDPVSSDAMLRGLALGGTSPDEWTPRFSSGVYNYNVAVPTPPNAHSSSPCPPTWGPSSPST